MDEITRTSERQKKPKKLGKRKCAHCREIFQKALPLQSVCGPVCAAGKAAADRRRLAQKAQKEQARNERRQDALRRESLKKRSKLAREAQDAVNAYARWLDEEESCISCETWDADVFQAGHYLTVGAMPALRYDLRNIHKQCLRCNQGAGNIHGYQGSIGYRKGLAKRYGQALVDWLEGPHEPKHYSPDDLREIRDTYRRLLSEGRRQKGAAAGYPLGRHGGDDPRGIKAMFGADIKQLGEIR